VNPADIRAVYERLTTLPAGGRIDFVTLGCPHYTLEQLRFVAQWLQANDANVHSDVQLWVCTNRMTRLAAAWEGITQRIEAAGGRVIADTCPVECHMRTSTCKELGLPTPQVEAMVTDSCKMARYVGDLIGCRTALRDRVSCLRAAVAGKLV
jgi:predicted aconitase